MKATRRKPKELAPNRMQKSAAAAGVDKEKRAEELRAHVMHRWQRAIRAANDAYERDMEELAGTGRFLDLKVRDVPRGEPERLIRETVYAIANAVRWGCYAACDTFGAGGERFEIGDEDLQVLRRIHRALRPPVDGRTSGDAVMLALSIVEKHACSYQLTAANEGKAHPDLPSPFRVGSASCVLAAELTTSVHSEFRRLLARIEPGSFEGRKEKIDRLLARYTSGRGRRAKMGEPSKLTASGILVELNVMASKPLGGLTIKSIDRLRDRMRNTPLQ